MPDKNTRNMDVYVPNFDFMLQDKLDNITPEQLEKMPTELRHKVFKNGDAIIDKLKFQEKWLILSICFNHTICVVTFDEEKGFGKNEIKDAVLAQAGRIKNDKLLDDMNVNSIFIQGNKEVMQALSYINHAQCSEIYNLFKVAHPKEKSKKEVKFDEWRKARSRIISAFRHFEANKRKILESHDMPIAKLYVLLFFYDGDKRGQEFYNTAFSNAFSCNRAVLHKSLLQMVRDGYLDGRGNRNNVRYSLTAKGMELADRLFDKLIYSY